MLKKNLKIAPILAIYLMNFDCQQFNKSVFVYNGV